MMTSVFAKRLLDWIVVSYLHCCKSLCLVPDFAVLNGLAPSLALVEAQPNVFSVLQHTSSDTPCDLLVQYHRILLDHQTLDLVLDRTDLAHEIGGLVGGDGAADDGSADTASTAKGHLGWDVDLE